MLFIDLAGCGGRGWPGWGWGGPGRAGAGARQAGRAEAHVHTQLERPNAGGPLCYHLPPLPPCLPAYTCSIMQDCKASTGLEQIAELMAAGKLKAHLERQVTSHYGSRFKG